MTAPAFTVVQTPRWWMVIESATGVCCDVADTAEEACEIAERLDVADLESAVTS